MSEGILPKAQTPVLDISTKTDTMQIDEQILQCKSTKEGMFLISDLNIYLDCWTIEACIIAKDSKIIMWFNVPSKGVLFNYMLLHPSKIDISTTFQEAPTKF